MKFQRLLIFSLVLVLLAVVTERVPAQSSDQSLPTPALSNEINGRVTRHFYAFEGNPGDLLITIDSKNRNGDLDVFTAITFRPYFWNYSVKERKEVRRLSPLGTNFIFSFHQQTGP